MKLFLLGVTGRVGNKIADYALKDGITVKSIIRNPDKVDPEMLNNISWIKGDVRGEQLLSEGMRGSDVVISALSTDGGTVLTEVTPLLIKAMKENKIERLITIGTAGILQSRSEPHLLRYQSSESKRKLTRAAEEHHKAYQLIKESGLDWTIICPTYLPDGMATGKYRTEMDFLPEDGSQISTGDTAHFAFSLLQDQSGFHQNRVGIAY